MTDTDGKLGASENHQLRQKPITASPAPTDAIFRQMMALRDQTCQFGISDRFDRLLIDVQVIV